MEKTNKTVGKTTSDLVIVGSYKNVFKVYEDMTLDKIYDTINEFSISINNRHLNVKKTCFLYGMKTPKKVVLVNMIDETGIPALGVVFKDKKEFLSYIEGMEKIGYKVNN